MNSDRYNEIQAYAESNGLELTESTTAANGYPQELCYALTGFETYGEAQEAANQLGGMVEHLQKKAGWQLWYRNGNTAYEPYRLSCEDLGYYCETADPEEFEETAREEISAAIQNDQSLEKISQLVTGLLEIEEAVNSLQDGEVVFFAKDGNPTAFEITPKHVMGYSEDSTEYTIGVIFGMEGVLL